LPGPRRLAEVFRGVAVDGERAVGLNPAMRLYRYGPGQRFGRHVDDSVELGPGRSTRYTLLVYLSGRGGGGGNGGGGGGGSGGEGVGGPKQAGEQPPAGAGGGRPKRAAGGRQQAAAPAPAAAAAPPVAAAVQAGFAGGETVFYGPRGRVLASVAPQPGLALCHLHGEDR
jgi:hypothetical protein